MRSRIIVRITRHAWVAALFAVAIACDAGPTAPAPTPESPTADAVGEASSGFTSPQTLGEHSPEVLARRWIAHASRLFERATRAAGPNPEPPISSWLQAAEQMLAQSIGSFDAGNYDAAIAQARSSAEKSKKVLDALAPEPGPQDLETIAARAITSAENLLDRAVALAGTNPDGEVAEALERARHLLTQAKDAFEAGDFADAARLARSSAAISRRVIDHLSSSGFGARG